MGPDENQLTCHWPGPLVYSYGTASGCRRSSALIVSVAAAIRSTWAAVSRYPLGGTFWALTSTGVFGSVAVAVTVFVTVTADPAAADAVAGTANTARTAAIRKARKSAASFGRSASRP